MTKKQIAIMGGTFSPITIGHIQVAKHVLNNSNIDEVWISPCYDHIQKKDIILSYHRHEMCRLATQDYSKIKVFDYEIKHKLNGSTYQTVTYIQNDPEFKDCEFSWIIGLDNANSFNKWINYEELMKIIRFIVVPRKGYVVDPTIEWYLNPPHIFIGSREVPVAEISSTIVRNLFSEKNIEEVKKYLHPDVFSYIQKEELY